MKKLLLCIAILAVMTFVACSEDEKDYTPNYLGCQHCDIPEEEGYEVCTGENGNAYVGNADTGIELVQYYSLFCDNEPVIFSPNGSGGNGGGGGGNGDCVTCVAMGMEMPEICEGDNGNAVIMGQDTGVDYDQYVEGIQAGGAECD